MLCNLYTQVFISQKHFQCFNVTFSSKQNDIIFFPRKCIPFQLRRSIVMARPLIASTTINNAAFRWALALKSLSVWMPLKRVLRNDGAVHGADLFYKFLYSAHKHKPMLLAISVIKTCLGTSEEIIFEDVEEQWLESSNVAYQRCAI